MVRLQQNIFKSKANPSSIWILRSELLFITGLLPIFLIFLYVTLGQYRLVVSSAEQNAVNLTAQVVGEYKQSVDGLGQMLWVLSQAPVVRTGSDVELCNRFLASVHQRYNRYANLGVARRDGSIWCGAAASDHATTVADKDFFVGAIQNKTFFSGEHQIDRATGQSFANFGMPIIQQDGRISGVVFASLDLAWLNRLVNLSSAPAGTVFTIFDRHGTVIARNRDVGNQLGLDASREPIFRYAVGHPAAGTIELKGLDNVERLYAFASIFNKFQEPLYISLGIPMSLIVFQADRVALQDLEGLLATLLVGMVLVFLVGRSLLVSRIRLMQEVSNLKSEFVALAAHQIKTPVAEMRNYIEILLDELGGPLTSKQRQYLEEMREIALSNTQLVYNLLNLSRLERGMIEAHVSPTNFSDLIEELVERYQPRVERKGLQLILNNDSLVLTANIDRGMTLEALANIVDNAMKFTDEGTITVTVKKSATSAIVTVADTGRGMETKRLRALLDLVEPLKGGPVSGEGAGLGIYIAKKFLEIQGGTLDGQSMPGRGTIFLVSVPLISI